MPDSLLRQARSERPKVADFRLSDSRRVRQLRWRRWSVCLARLATGWLIASRPHIRVEPIREAVEFRAILAAVRPLANGLHCLPKGSDYHFIFVVASVHLG